MLAEAERSARSGRRGRAATYRTRVSRLGRTSAAAPAGKGTASSAFLTSSAGRRPVAKSERGRRACGDERLQRREGARRGVDRTTGRVEGIGLPPS